MTQRKTDEADTDPRLQGRPLRSFYEGTSRNLDDAKRLRSCVVVTFCWN